MNTRKSIVLLAILALSCDPRPTALTREPTGNEVPDTTILSSGRTIDPNSLKKKPQKTVAKVSRAAVPVVTNQVPAGTPKSVPVPEHLTVITPGKDGVPFPEIVAAVGEPGPVIQPQPVLARSPEIKDNAVGDILHYHVNQGMSSAVVHALLEDRRGNLWIGTGGGGVSRYDGHHFLHFSEREGLPYSSVHALLEDRRGNIWIGTDGGGLSCYNGQNFIHYTTEEGLTGNNVEAIFEDRQGDLWIGTRDGLNRYDGKQITRYTEREGLTDNYVKTVFQDRRGDLWIGTEEGLNKFDGKSFTHYTERDGLISHNVSAIQEDRNGHLWLGSDGGGIARYDGRHFMHLTTREGLSDDAVYSLFIDSSGYIWTGTARGGVNLYDGEHFTYFSDREGLTTDRILSILEDRDGNLWFGIRGDGLYKYNRKSFVHRDDIVYPYGKDRNGRLLGIRRGAVSRYDPDEQTVLPLIGEETLKNNAIYTILEDSRGYIWVSVRSQGVYRYDPSPEQGELILFTQEEGLVSNDVSSLFEDSLGNIWVGTHSAGVTRLGAAEAGPGEPPLPGLGAITIFTEEEGLVHNHVHAITEDQDGHIWIGTDGGGVSKYDGRSFTNLTRNDGLGGDQINTIKVDRQGNIWFGTWNAGLTIFDGKTFTYLNKEDGLSSNIISSIVEDDQGRFWVSTEQGLNVLIPKQHDSTAFSKSGMPDFQIISFDGRDGLKSINVSPGCRDDKNHLWWGSTMIDLNTFAFPTQPPLIQLNALELQQMFVDYRALTDEAYVNSLPFGQNLKGAFDRVAPFCNYPEQPALPHYVDHLTFHFSAIDWLAPHKISYQFMLQGQDETWNPVTPDNKADYRSIAPGTYTFRVRAAGQTMLWSEPLEYTFTILPPWWLTWWAKLLYALIAAGAVWAFVRWRTAALQERQRVLEQTVRERTAEVVEQKEEAERQRERAERSEKYKEQFLANMSHEIRTPMNAISGMTKILRRNDHPPEQDKYLDAIHQSSENLLVILNDILDLAKIEAGKIEIESIPVNLRSVVYNVVDILKFKAEEKGLRMNSHWAEDLPELVMGDPTRLSQILINLAGNAIKFSDKGDIEISIARNDNGDALRFCVKDSGIGIPADKLEGIFGSFEQAAGSTTRKYGGTGLGLSITKQLVELQNGRIWAQSEEGCGSAFYFELPLIPAADQPERQSTLTEEQLREMGASLTGLKILLAEDNSFNAMIAEDDLSYYIPDVKIDIANDGLDALEKFRTGVYDLVLMDVQMPELSGLEVSERIRALEASENGRKSTPIIAMTASLLKAEIDQCYRAGMNSYIPKPYKNEELVGKIFATAG